MKNNLTSLIMVLLLISSCKTQNILTSKRFSANGITYVNNGENMGRLMGNYYLINNVTNKLEGTEPYPNKPKDYRLEVSALQIDKDLVKKLIADEFSIKRLKDLLPEKYLNIFMYVNEHGKVVEMFFSVRANSKIKPKELANIEKSLKTNFKVGFKDRKSFEGISYFSVDGTAFFDELIKIKQAE